MTSTTLTRLETELAPVAGVSRLVENFMSRTKATTKRTYGGALRDFARFVGASDLPDAAARLMASGAGEANAIALDYVTNLRARNLSSATIAVRLTALRALVDMARMAGLVAFRVEVKGPRVKRYRDTTGPGPEEVKRALRTLEGQDTPKARRDAAIIRIFSDLALRCSEVTGLDVAHVELERGRVWVWGKGEDERKPKTLPDETLAALRKWLAVRGTEPGPLFVNFDRAGKGGRLTPTSVGRITNAHGLGHPHGLRHTAITRALDLLQGNVRDVAKYSRHQDIRTVAIYDDARRDVAGEVARRVAASWSA